MHKKMVRVSFTVPPSLNDDLVFVSRKMGASKSACLTSLLKTPLSDLRNLLESVPDNPTPDEVLRARGVSNRILLDRFQAYVSALDDQEDLFDADNH
jgi:hypothetical protein